MVIEGEKDSLLTKILDRQFEIIGEKITFADLPEDGIITINGKKMYWYEHYKWESMEQYEDWKKWAYDLLSVLGKAKADYVMLYADLRYGLVVRYKKEGTLF